MFMLRKVEVDDVEDDEVKWEEGDDVESDDAEEEEGGDDVEGDDVEEEDRYFVRTCAIKMHLHMLQEPFCTRICR